MAPCCIDLAVDKENDGIYVVRVDGTWSDSRHVFYRALPSRIMSVTIQTTPELSGSAPVMAFDLEKLRVNPYSWDILPDGRLLAVQRGRGEDEVREFNIVVNWLSELRQRMAK